VDGFGEGVARDFLSGCIKQLSEELLAPVGVDSDFYNIKPDLDLGSQATKRKLVVLGYVLGIMVANGWSFPFKLKRCLLHMCLYNTSPTQDGSYIIYQLMEDPESMAFMLALMRKPEDIERSGLDFEDIGRKPKPVTMGNFLSYMRNWVQHGYVPAGCKYVAQGFFVKTKAASYCSKRGYGVHTLFETLCVPVMDVERMKKFVEEQIVFDENVPRNTQAWFKAIVAKSKPDFLRNLLHFWSGSYTPVPNQKYQVMQGESVIAGKVCPLPKARTCFFQLFLPKNVPSQKKLSEILETAVGYVETGVGLERNDRW